ncbi:unnamed protein product [Auanema sp. JU1783]|nr:unnamed protein product [Auanema sp. JU1783]
MSDDEGTLSQAEARKNMSKMPLSQVRAMKEKLGIKLFNKAYFGEESGIQKAGKSKKFSEEDGSSERDVAEKRGQHRPKEVSSRKRVSAFRNIYPDTKTKQKWDPRFDERAGTFKEVCFEDNYRFLDDVRKEEKEDLRKTIRENVEAGRDIREYADKLNRLETQERAQKQKRLKNDTIKELRQENIDRMMQGQKPIFKTKADVRKKIMEKKYDQLKQENRLSKYLDKKEKKQSEKLMKQKPEAFESKYGYH